MFHFTRNPSSACCPAWSGEVPFASVRARQASRRDIPLQQPGLCFSNRTEKTCIAPGGCAPQLLTGQRFGDDKGKLARPQGRIGEHCLEGLDDILLLYFHMPGINQRQMLVRPACQLTEGGIAVSDKALDIRRLEEPSEILPENIVYRIDLNFVNRVHIAEIDESRE